MKTAIFSTRVVFISVAKSLSPEGNFFEKNFSQPYFQGRCRGSWEVGKPHFPHTIFFIFILFSRHYAALHRQARDCFSVIQLLPIIARMKIASHDHDHSQLLRPSPSLPHDSDHAECGGVHSYTDRLRFSIFVFGYLGPLAKTLDQIFGEVPKRISF